MFSIDGAEKNKSVGWGLISPVALTTISSEQLYDDLILKKPFTMSAYKTKSWTEKMNICKHPVVEVVKKPFADIKVGDKMLIPTPEIVEDYIKLIPKGKHVDISTIRKDLAAAYGADITCPLTTGIFIRVVAEAAYESYKAGTPLKKIAPFWRVIDERSKTASKLTFGTEFLKAQRRKEHIGINAKALLL